MGEFSREIDVFEFNSNLGLRKQGEEEPHVKEFANWLKIHGFYKKIKPRKIRKLEPPIYRMEFAHDSGILNEDDILAYALAQEKILANELLDPSFKLIIGGDCSILVGNAFALKKKGEYGLFFLDGHTDYTSEKISATKAVAGMDLAIATGWGTDKLANIEGLAPYFRPEHVYCVGNKENERAYLQPMLEAMIHYYDREKVGLLGAEKIATSFLTHISDQNLTGFLIHFDVDVLAGKIMPAVDSYADEGLTYEEVMELLMPLVHSGKCVGLEITIFDPAQDPSGELITEFIQHISTLF